MTSSEPPPHPIGRQFVAGLLLLVFAWPIAWSNVIPWSTYSFFPLWLGYILTVDGLVLWRTDTSLLTRNSKRFLLLFVLSAPLWWLFEAANSVLQNWQYHSPGTVSTNAYLLLASVAFATVIPALFETAELYRSLPWFRTAHHWLRLTPSRFGLIAISLGGVLLIAAALLFPRQAYPLIWVGGFFALDPLNALFGAPSISAQVARGRWDTVLVLFAAGLTCGFFWEMWNFYSLPKWTYHTPYVTMPKLFEMPLLGYGGYLPFSLEVYAIYHFLLLLVLRHPKPYLSFDEPEDESLGH